MDSGLHKISYKVIRTYNLLLAILPVIGFYRASVQQDYEWGLLAISGMGRSSQYPFLIGFMLLAWTSFLLERWYKRRWYYSLPVILFGLVAAVLIYGLIQETNMEFRGEAWKIGFRFGWFVALLSVMCWLLCIVWSLWDLREFKSVTIHLDSRGVREMVGILFLGVVVILLFAQGSGEVHSGLDRAAVFLTVLQGLWLASLNDRCWK